MTASSERAILAGTTMAQESLVHDEEPLYLAGRGFSWTVNPSCPSTLTAPVFPPSKSLESSRWPVANS